VLAARLTLHARALSATNEAIVLVRDATETST
jgi:hypothetical protein